MMSTSFVGGTDSESPIDETFFSSWLEAVLVVKFDVRDGQMVEEIFPKSHILSDLEVKKLCNLSLPDANNGHDGDVQFSFRIRQGVIPPHSMSPLQHSFLFATAFYRQTRDETQPRGYFQKSVVLISRHPYASFLEDCVRVIGPLYFEFGKNVLKAVCADIRTWDPPIPGVSYELPLGGSIIYFRVPWSGRKDDEILKEQSLILKSKISNSKVVREEKESLAKEYYSDDNTDDSDSLPSPPPSPITLRHVFEAKTQENPGLFQSIPLFSTFGGLSVALWHIWELAIVGEPIIVLAPTPDRCSRAVLAIASLIAPLIYSGDYRPYFTIYDPDFAEICKTHNELRGQYMPSTVLGVTNPYFLKALEYWPNVISVGHMGYNSNKCDKESNEGESKNLPGKGKKRTRRLSIESVDRKNLSVRGDTITSAEYCPTVAKRSESLKNLLSNQQYENSIILTRDDPLISPDESVLKQLMVHKTTEETKAAATAAAVAGEAWEAPAVAINNAILRQHFRRLTEEFLRPLEKYFKLEAVGGRAARARGIQFSAHSQNRSFGMNMHQFNVDAFMQQLEYEMPRKILQNSNWRQLYRNFISGPNFWPWFTLKRMELNEKLTYIHRHLKLNTDVELIVQKALQNRSMAKRQASDDDVEAELLKGSDEDILTPSRMHTRSAPPDQCIIS